VSALRRFCSRKSAVIGAVVLLVVSVLCFGASWLAPFAKNKQDLTAPVAGPSWDHLFGVDRLGRDYFTEVLYAGQLSLKIGLVVGALATAVGVAAGLLAGYFGRLVDDALMRLTDLFLVLPAVTVLAIALKGFGQSDLTIILVLAAIGWMRVARVVRTQVLSLREKEYVTAAQALGASHRRVMLRHLLPNTVGPIMVNATFAVAAAITAEATLSFLGFGVQIPRTSWGTMLQKASGTVGTSSVHLLYFPGLMLLLVVLSVNFVGDGLRDAFNPEGHS
jgi:peptide/nickel transport system permease protein